MDQQYDKKKVVFYGLASPKYGMRQNNNAYSRMSGAIPKNIEV